MLLQAKAIVQSVTFVYIVNRTALAGSAGVTSITSVATNTTNCDLLVAVVAQDNTGTGTVFTDNYGNTYTTITTVNDGNLCQLAMGYVAHPVVGTAHQFTASNVARPALFVEGFSCSPAVAYRQNTTGIAPAGSTSLKLPLLTPSQDNELMVCAVAQSASVPTIDSGFTRTNQGSFNATRVMGGALAYLIQTTAAPVAPTWTGVTAQYVSIMASFTP